MGQYYIALILGEKRSAADKEIIRMELDPMNYANGAKLTEHSYVGNDFVSVVEFLLSENGMFYKSRLVWAGDYADPEPETNGTLDHAPKPQPRFFFPGIPDTCVKYVKGLRYIVNHTKQQYVDKNGHTYHPLPLLTAEGNGRGGGDYHGAGEEHIGSWSRDVISMESEPPAEGYALLTLPSW